MPGKPARAIACSASVVRRAFLGTLVIVPLHSTPGVRALHRHRRHQKFAIVGITGTVLGVLKAVEGVVAWARATVMLVVTAKRSGHALVIEIIDSDIANNYECS